MVVGPKGRTPRMVGNFGGVGMRRELRICRLKRIDLHRKVLYVGLYECIDSLSSVSDFEVVPNTN